MALSSVISYLLLNIQFDIERQRNGIPRPPLLHKNFAYHPLPCATFAKYLQVRLKALQSQILATVTSSFPPLCRTTASHLKLEKRRKLVENLPRIEERKATGNAKGGCIKRWKRYPATTQLPLTYSCKYPFYLPISSFAFCSFPSHEPWNKKVVCKI